MTLIYSLLAVQIYNLMSEARVQCFDDIHYRKNTFHVSMKVCFIIYGSYKMFKLNHIDIQLVFVYIKMSTYQ